MINKLTLITLVVAISVVPCQAAVTNLTAESLGLDSGNYGTSLIINDFVQLTAITHIGQSDGPQIGDVYLGNNDHGFGIQTEGRNGQKGITGNGHDYAESLVLDFAGEIPASSIQLGLFNYERNSDDIVLDLETGGNKVASFTKSNTNWNSSVSSIGGCRYVIDFSTLLNGVDSQTVDRLTVTVLSGQVYVNGIGLDLTMATVPEPATLALLGFGCLAALPVRKRT